MEGQVKVCPICGAVNKNVVFYETTTYECEKCGSLISQDDKVMEMSKEEQSS